MTTPSPHQPEEYYKRDHIHCFLDRDDHKNHLSCCLCKTRNEHQPEEWVERFDKEFPHALTTLEDKIHLLSFIHTERQAAKEEVFKDLMRYRMLDGVIEIVPSQVEKLASQHNITL